MDLWWMYLLSSYGLVNQQTFNCVARWVSRCICIHQNMTRYGKGKNIAMYPIAGCDDQRVSALTNKYIMK